MKEEVVGCNTSKHCCRGHTTQRPRHSTPGSVFILQALYSSPPGVHGNEFYAGGESHLIEDGHHADRAQQEAQHQHAHRHARHVTYGAVSEDYTV